MCVQVVVFVHGLVKQCRLEIIFHKLMLLMFKLLMMRGVQTAAVGEQTQDGRLRLVHAHIQIKSKHSEKVHFCSIESLKRDSSYPRVIGICIMLVFQQFNSYHETDEEDADNVSDGIVRTCNGSNSEETIQENECSCITGRAAVEFDVELLDVVSNNIFL